MCVTISVDHAQKIIYSKFHVIEFQYNPTEDNTTLIHRPVNFTYLSKLLKNKGYHHGHVVVAYSSLKQVFRILPSLVNKKVYISYRKGEPLTKFTSNPDIKPITLQRKLGKLIKLIK